MFYVTDEALYFKFFSLSNHSLKKWEKELFWSQMSYLINAQVEIDVVFWEATWIIFKKISGDLPDWIRLLFLSLTFAISDEYLF